MNIVGGIFFTAMGLSLIFRTDYWLVRIEEQDSRIRIMRWVRGTAYGRWFAGVEPTFLRVMGVLSILVAIATVADWP